MRDAVLQEMSWGEMIVDSPVMVVVVVVGVEDAVLQEM